MRQLKIEIDWPMAACRALFIKQMSEKQIVELHQMENTRAERYFGHYEDYKKNPDNYPNWLIYPFNMKRIFKNLQSHTITQGDMDLIISIISKKMPPEEVLEGGSHSSSVEWQHSWDWTIYHDVPVLMLTEKSRKHSLADSIEEKIGSAHRESM